MQDCTPLAPTRRESDGSRSSWARDPLPRGSPRVDTDRSINGRSRGPAAVESGNQLTSEFDLVTEWSHGLLTANANPPGLRLLGAGTQVLACLGGGLKLVIPGGIAGSPAELGPT